jgi:Ca2+/Na+ antiporter
MREIVLSSELTDALLLLAGALGLLAAVLVTAGGLAVENAGPTRRAVAHALPIAVAAIVATVLGHPEMAIGIIFGTSIAAMSAVAGFVTLAGPLDQVPRPAQRLWAFLPMAATLAFVIGFHGNVGLFDAALLAGQGVLLMGMCHEKCDVGADVGAALAAVLPPPAAEPAPAPPTRPLELLFALALAALGAWAATRGAEGLTRQDIRYSTATLSGILLSVALVMPMISTGVQAASKGRAWNPLTAQVGLVLLNLCVTLPLVIVIGGGIERAGMLAAATRPIWGTVLFPRNVWRIDALAVVILSLALLPVANGRIKLDRRLAVWLIGGYFAYMLLVFVADLHR